MNKEKILDKINIYQSKKGYRFSVDSFLLSGFINSNKKNQKLLDIGTGVGIIPILLKKKFPEWQLDGVEIQYKLYNLARKNYILNKIEGNLYCDDVKKLKSYNCYDVIVTNPPFFKNGLISSNEEIAKSKHEICLTINDLIKKTDKLLKSRGYFYCIYSSDRLLDLIFELKNSNINPFAIKLIYSSKKEKSKIFLIACRKNIKSPLKFLKPFFIYEKINLHSKEMNLLYNSGRIIW